MRDLTAVSLFSGFGMFDLGVAVAGYDIIAQVEIADYCRKVLTRHAESYWPNAAQFTDVREFGRESVDQAVDLIFGGFPCQPFSVAGKAQGEADNRNLWPEFARIIGELRPKAIMLENVPRITQAYKVEGELRPAYALTIIGDLATLGYDARWRIISAASIGAPHPRERWWCVAYANGQRHTEPAARQEAAHDSQRHDPPHQQEGHTDDDAAVAGREILVDATGEGLEKSEQATGRTHTAQAQAGLVTEPQRTDSNVGNALRVPVARVRAEGKQVAKTFTEAKLSQRPGYRIRRFTRNAIFKSGMGRAAYGPTSWVDGLRWPAGQGVLQHPYEKPRSIEREAKDDKWKDRIEGLGNGGMWPIAYELACRIADAIIEEERSGRATT